MIITDIGILKKRSELADPNEAKEIIKKLERELKASTGKGIGLAAPQIGILKCVAIVRTENESLDLVNPIIKETRGLFISRNEGCLSCPGVKVDTWRYREILVVDDLHPSGVVAEGLESVVIQHEIHHLEGILITDRKAEKIGRNDPCPCGAKRPDGKPIKFKKCHGR